MQNGGRRAGAGRPKNSVSKRTAAIRDISKEAIEKGITPLEVMLNNMRFYVDEADKLLAKILLGKKSTPELVKALKDLISFRSQAQSCAVDAAPYVHSRLAHQTISGDPNAPLEVVNVIEHIISSDPVRHVRRTNTPSLPAPTETGEV
jgi:hypothetical protein